MAPRKCCIKFCRSTINNDNKSGLHHHGLPSCAETRPKWLQWIAKVNDDDSVFQKKNISLCGEHFESKYKRGSRLVRGAVPTLDNQINNSIEFHEESRNKLDLENGNGRGIDVSSIGSAQAHDQSAVVYIDTNTNSTSENEVDEENRNKLDLHNANGCGIHVSSIGSAQAHDHSAIVYIDSNTNSTSENIESGVGTNSIDIDDVLSKFRDFMNFTHSEFQHEYGDDAAVSSVVFISTNTDTPVPIIDYVPDSIVDINTGSIVTDTNTATMEANGNAGSANYCANATTQPNEIFPEEIQFEQDFEAYEILPEEVQFEQDFVTLDDLNNQAEVIFHEDSSIILPEQDCNKNPNKISSAKKKSQKKCSANGCVHSGHTMHSFPSAIVNGELNLDNLNRCKLWIKNSGNHDFLKMKRFNLHRNFYICSNHFDDTQYFNSSRKRIRPTAVPTLFDGCPLSDDQVNSLFPLTHDDVVHVDIDNVEYTLEERYVKKFYEIMNSLQRRTCPNCKETFLVKSSSRIKCLHNKQQCLQYSALNDMDPGEQPPELKGLTYIEEQLIARISPILTVFKLKGHQFGYSGNVINFPQDIKPIAKQLPHRLEDLSSVITIRAGSEIKPVDFQIRNEKVRTALKYLIENNPYYHDVEISEENLNLLPEDGNFYETVKSFTLQDEDQENDLNESNKSDTSTNSSPVHEKDVPQMSNTSLDSDEDISDTESEENYETVIESGVPMVGKPSETVQLQSALNWPTRENTPVSEFSMVGYVCMAFPCLFPNGKADLNAPRETKISALNYFKHLMRFHDDRFAQHPRFRFFALNSLMRWSALKDGNIFIQNHPEYKDMTAGDLKKLVQDDPNAIKKMMFQSSNIRGTRAYWYARGKELLSMIEQIGMPTLFFTLSCADFHWQDLYKILAPDKDPDLVTELDRRKLIEENPELVDAFFSERASTFITEVLNKKFDVKDFWYRIEYQHRGSPHVHGLLWIKDAPDVTNLLNATLEEKENIIEFFDKLVSTTHPNINERVAPSHPCRIQPDDIEDKQKDLAQLLNKVQRHTKCSDSYCIRVNKKTKKKQCRFDFPKELQQETELLLNDKNEYELVTARNDSRLNNYNAYVIQAWRANIDFSPVLSKQRLINYLAKYISKPEKESKQLIEVLKELLSRTDEDKSAKNIIQRLYIQCCSERDYSAQETCHLIAGRKLVSSGGRKFVTINFKSNPEWIFVPREKNKVTKTIFDRYKSRISDHESECLCTMAKTYNFLTGRKYAKEAIVQIYPRYRKPSQEDNDDPFYKQQVLLYVPWRHETEFMTEGLSWKDNFLMHQETIRNNSLKELDFSNINPEEDIFEEIEIDEETYALEEWMTLSKMGSNQNITAVELGRRDADINYDWHQTLPQYEKYGGVPALTCFLDLQKATNIIDTSIPPFPNVTFSSEQETILKLLELQIASVTEDNFSANHVIPKRIIVQGKAGTGKSLIIQAITHKIHSALGHGAYIIITPTGVSAKNVNGATYQSTLSINSKTKEFLPLKGQAAHNLEKKFQKVQWILADEFSMIGCGAMNMIQDRIQQAKGNYAEDFGGCFVYIFGDVQQLPPIGDTAVYSDKQLSSETLRGKLVYNNFDGAVILSNIQRQKDEAFQKVLNNIGEGNITLEDYEILKTRFTTSISKKERDEFKDVVHLYSTRLEVLNLNKNTLENLTDSKGQRRPIARIPAWHNIPEASTGSVQDAEGLYPVLYLAEGCTIMLKHNIWTDVGLVNGAIGEIIHILYEDNASPPNDRPVAIICRFRSYNGPFLDNDLRTVPLVPISRSWTNKQGETCTRVQFPITLCYACSIHSSQSLSLDKVFVNIGLKEMATGITYVALTRAKSLKGVLLEPFTFKRLLKVGQRKSLTARNMWLEQLKNYVLTLTEI